MRITLLAVGKIRRKELRVACETYARRIPHYLRFDSVEVRDEPARSGRTPQEIRAREGERLSARIPHGARVVLLDETGRTPTSEQWAAELGQLRDRGQRDLCLIIGGPLGLDPQLKASGHDMLALSAFTLPHEMARLLLLEQIYRACTILAGEPYHNS